MGHRKLVQWLRALVFLAEGLGLVPSTLMVVHNLYNSSSNGFNALFDFCGQQACMWYMSVHAGKELIYIILSK